MEKLLVEIWDNDAGRLWDVLSGEIDEAVDESYDGCSAPAIKKVSADDMASHRDILKSKKVVFAVKISADGICGSLDRFLVFLKKNPDVLEGSVGVVIVDGDGENYTKSAARQLVYEANRCGCAFLGRPLVEATGSLDNFRVQAENLGVDLMGAYKAAVSDLFQRLGDFEFPGAPGRILAVHASNAASSNTYALWKMISGHLAEAGVEIREVNLRNGSIKDCGGCPYPTCLHFGEKGSCFYGGPMVEEVYPALLEADGLMILSPNYNDALPAAITAFINRLTALFRVRRFYDKSIYSVIVSGYSGGDIIAGQIISAMNMNKSFYLPARFCICETANDPGAILNLPGIGSRASAFAKNMYICHRPG